MDEETSPDDLPERVRARIVQVVSDALPAIADLPAPLRRVAAFAPARRAKLGASAILTALQTDDFRQRAATQVAARRPELMVALGEPGGAPVDAAAAAWLGRADGWQRQLADAVRRLADAAAAEPVAEAELLRLRGQVEALQQTLHEVRAEHKARLESVKDENTALRRKLNDARQSERAASADRDAAEAELAEQLAAAQQAATRTEAEIRRLRAQVEGLERDRSVQRAETRSTRDAANLRARLLLDTVVDAATGLKRELGLPAVTGAPADAVEEALTDERQAPTKTRPPTAKVLERMLGLPRAHLIIDGYNVSKTAWPTASLEGQRRRLLQSLAPLVARTGAETTVVFDAATAPTRRVMPAPRGIRVMFSPEGVIADEVIQQLVAAEPTGRVVVVVSSDREVVRDATRAGARTAPSESLVEILTA